MWLFQQCYHIPISIKSSHSLILHNASRRKASCPSLFSWVISLLVLLYFPSKCQGHSDVPGQAVSVDGPELRCKERLRKRAALTSARRSRGQRSPGQHKHSPGVQGRKSFSGSDSSPEPPHFQCSYAAATRKATFHFPRHCWSIFLKYCRAFIRFATLDKVLPVYLHYNK